MNLNKTLKSILINEYKSTLRFKVDYWEHRYDREYHYDYGSQNSLISHAKEELDKFNMYGKFEDIETGDLCLCIRGAMRKLYIEAQDFNFNPFICVKNLRRVVELRNYLNFLNKDYEIYSTKYLMNIKIIRD